MELKNVNCPACKSAQFYKSGFYNAAQVYQCKGCGRKFTQKSLDFFYRFKYHPRIISFALQVYYRKRMKFVNISNLLRRLGIEVSSKQVGVWVAKCSETLGEQMRQFKIPEYTNPWHLEIDRVSIKGRRGWLHTVYDSSGNILTTLLAKGKSVDSIKFALREAGREAGFLPSTIVANATAEVEEAMHQLGAKPKSVRHFEME